MIPSEGGSTPRLKRTIGLFQATIFGIGLILGAGIYSIIGEAAGIAGNIVWISFIIAGLLALIIGLSYAELSSIFSKSAAEYLFVREAFDNEFLSLSIGYIVIFVVILSAASVAVGFSGYMTIFIPHIPEIIIAIILIVLLSVVNFYGISESININILFTFIEIGGLLFIIIAAFASGQAYNTNYFEVPVNSPSNLHPSLIFGLIFSAAGLIFFAFFGFENVVNIADETKIPNKTIPKALMISIIVTIVIYIIVAISAISLVGWHDLYLSEAPLAKAAEKSSGILGTFILSIIALFATSNTVLMMLISGSRLIYGISNDRKSTLPNILSKVHSKRRTPWLSIFIVMFIAIMIVILFKGNLSVIAGVTVFCVLVVYIIINIALIRLRYKKRKVDGQFSSPISIKRFPILPGLGIVLSVIILLQFELHVMLDGIICIIGIIFFVYISRTIGRLVNVYRKK
ncbi:MAG TPA: APC family permease [Candidatus Nitrosocosmicus sp.]|nr:APC family permease [Candidatus Nitrosocosmicus sp.]